MYVFCTFLISVCKITTTYTICVYFVLFFPIALTFVNTLRGLLCISNLFYQILLVPLHL